MSLLQGKKGRSLMSCKPEKLMAQSSRKMKLGKKINILPRQVAILCQILSNGICINLTLINLICLFSGYK